MSRTKRAYHGLKSNYVKTQEGLGFYYYSHDPRDKWDNGHDGASPAYYYSSYHGYGGKDNYKGRSRKFYKRQYAKGRRRKLAKEIEALIEA